MAALYARCDYAASPRSSSAVARRSLTHHFFLLAIGALTFLVHGYHPFADDAGLYVAGVEKLLDPTLFPVGMRFILSETRIESFYPLMIGVTKLLRWLTGEARCYSSIC